jgi:sn-glycerol 3-phosphate transport system ATP-binding protein
MARVEFRNVKKIYDGQPVIHGMDLQVADGEFLVIVGPSGCGKSTLLRMVAGLEAVSAGEIVIGERVVNALEPKDRDIAMVFQNYALYPHMSVYDNMAYGLRIRGMSRADIDARVQRAANILQLAPLLQRKPRQLSGGQRQRVAMGRAIVREPAVFLFDEPLSNLDAKLRVQMRFEMQDLHRSLRTTSLYVTHDQVEAMTLGDRLVVMNAGRIEQIGTPTQVYEKPQTLFVAGFVGSPPMNLLNVHRDDRGRVVFEDGVVFPAAAAFAVSLPEREIALGIRPEHLEPCSAAESVFETQVELVEVLGADNHAHVRCHGQRLIARLPQQLRPRVGSVLHLRPHSDRWHVYDRGSGMRA